MFKNCTLSEVDVGVLQDEAHEHSELSNKSYIIRGGLAGLKIQRVGLVIWSSFNFYWLLNALRRDTFCNDLPLCKNLR